MLHLLQRKAGLNPGNAGKPGTVHLRRFQQLLQRVHMDVLGPITTGSGCEQLGVCSQQG